jgi:membrane protein YdbS with pleckstrin-like domain
MLYSLTKGLALRLMKAPTKPPDAPAGSHGAIQVYRASPRFLTYRMLLFWIVISLNWIGPWVVCIVGVVEGDAGTILLGVVYALLLLLIQVCVYFAIRIDYDMRYYIVTDRSLRIREGAIIVKEKTISFANVQNLRVVRGPIMGLFGIWHLRVDTAGGGGSSDGKTERVAHRVQMAGIENAHEVRDRIRGHLRGQVASAGLGDLDDRDDDARAGVAVGGAFLEALRELQGATADLRTAMANRNDRT